MDKFTKAIQTRWKKIDFTLFLKEKTRLVFAAGILVAIVGSLVFTHKSSATLSVFYPEVCTGGWKNPSNAANSQSVDDGSPANMYTEDNSAVLNSSHSDITCGNFAGDIPNGATARTFTVNLHWSFDNGAVVHDGKKQDTTSLSSDVTTPSSAPDTTSTTPASTSTHPQDSTSTSTQTQTSDTSNTNTSSSNTTTPTVTPDSTATVPTTPAPVTSTESTPAPTPTEPTDTGPAQPQSPAQESAPVATPQAPATSSDATTGPQVSFGEKLLQIVKQGTALVQDALSSSTTAVDPNAVLDVRYTVDGTNWSSIGTVSASNWQNASFGISDPNIGAWTDLSKLQIGLFSLSKDGDQPAVYLDSMELSVNYDTPSASIVPTVKITDDSVGILKPEKTIFTLDQSPTFQVTDLGLSTYDIATLVKDNKATVVEDSLGALDSAVAQAQTSSMNTTSATNDTTSTTSSTATDNSVLNAPTASPIAVPQIPDMTKPSIDIPVSKPEPTPTPTPAPATSDTTAPAQTTDVTNTTPTDTTPAPTAPDTTTPTDTTASAVSAPASQPDAQPAPVQSAVDSVASSALGAFAIGAEALQAPTPRALLHRLTSFNFAGFLSALVEGAQNTTPSIEAVVLDSKGNQTTIPTLVQRVVVDGVTKTQVLVQKPDRVFVPGKYTLQVTLHTNQANIISQQDFNWGVLAINVDKSVYTVGDTAYVQIGVIDNFGNTVCDADLVLAVTDPNGSERGYTTSDGTITRNPECGPNNFIPDPDYYLRMPVGSVTGATTMTLTALTSEGTKMVSDSFTVNEINKFNVVRSGPTRVVPGHEYPEVITLTSNIDWSGTVIEKTPSIFTVASLSDVTDYDSLTTVGTDNVISWNLSLKAGKPVKIGYNFLPPPISPEFYLLGPLALYDTGVDITTTDPVFQESRSWQIADDATCTFNNGGGDSKWSTATNWDCGGGTHHVPATNDTVVIGDGSTTYSVSLDVDTNSLTALTITNASTLVTAYSGADHAITTLSLVINNGGTLNATSVSTGSAISLAATTGTAVATAFTMNSGGTFTPGSSTVTVGKNAGTYVCPTAFNAGTGNLTFYNLSIYCRSGSGLGTGTWTFGGAGLGSITVQNNLLVADDAGIAYNTMVLGQNVTVVGSTTVGNGTEIQLSSFTLSTGSLVTTGTSTNSDFKNSTGILKLTGTSSPLITTSAGAYVSGTGTVLVDTDANVTLTNNIAFTFYNLTLSPSTLTASRQYSFVATAVTVTNNFTVQPTATSINTLTAMLGAAMTITSGKVLVSGQDSTHGLATLDTSASSSFSLTTTGLEIEAGGTVLAQGSTITFTGNTAVTCVANSAEFCNNGTFNSGTSSVIFNPTVAGNFTIIGGSFNNSACDTTGLNCFNSLTPEQATGSTYSIESLGSAIRLKSTATLKLYNRVTFDTANFAVTTGFVWLDGSVVSPNFNANSSVITLTGSAAGTSCTTAGLHQTLFCSYYANFTATSSSIHVTGPVTQTVFGSGGGAAFTINDLTFDPILTGSAITYSLGTGVGATAIDGNVTLNPSDNGSGGSLTYTPPAAWTLATGKTITVKSAPSSTATAIYNSGNFLTSNASGTVDVEKGGTFNEQYTTSHTWTAVAIGTTTNGGTYNAGAGTISIITTLTLGGGGGGTFNGQTSSTTITNAATINSGAIFNGNTSSTGSTTFSGTVTVANGGTFNGGTNATVTCSMGMVVASGGTYNGGTTSTLALAGRITPDNSELSVSSTATFNPSNSIISIGNGGGNYYPLFSGTALTINFNTLNYNDGFYGCLSTDIVVAGTMTFGTSAPRMYMATGGTLGTSCGSTTHNITSGNIVISSGGGSTDIEPSGATITLTGTSGTLFTNNNTTGASAFDNAATGTIFVIKSAPTSDGTVTLFGGTAGSANHAGVIATSFTFSPVLATANTTYAFGVTPFLISNNFSVIPTGTGTLNVSQIATLPMVAGKTLLVQGTATANAVYNTSTNQITPSSAVAGSGVLVDVELNGTFNEGNNTQSFPSVSVGASTAGGTFNALASTGLTMGTLSVAVGGGGGTFTLGTSTSTITGTATIASGGTINGGSMSGGVCSGGSGTITFSSATTSATIFTNNSGTFTACSSSIIFNGAATSGGRLSGGTSTSTAFTGSNAFKNLYINNGSFAAPLGTDITVTGNLKIGTDGSTNTGGTLNTSTSNYAVTAANIILGASGGTAAGSILVANNSTITLTGVSTTTLLNRDASAGVFTAGGSTILVTSQSGSPSLFGGAMTGTSVVYKVTINTNTNSTTPGATIINAGGAFTTSNTSGSKFYLQSGIFNQGGSAITGGTTASVFQIDAPTSSTTFATFCIGGTTASTTADCMSGATQTSAVAFPTSFTTYTIDPSSTIIYLTNNATQTVFASSTFTYGNLTIAPKTTAASLLNYAMTAAPLNIAGNFTINPSGVASSSFAWTQAGAILIAPQFVSTNAVNRLLVQSSITGGGTATLTTGGNSIVTGTIDIEAGGIISSGASNITVSGNWINNVGATGFPSSTSSVLLGNSITTLPTTTLTTGGGINNSVLSFSVASATGFVVGETIQMDSEQMIITAVSGATITVGARGANGTAAASHSLGATTAVVVGIVNGTTSFANLII